MTRFIRNSSPPIKREIPCIQLTISGCQDGYRASYSNNLVLLSHHKRTIEIKLVNETTDGSSIVITDYSSTGVTAKHSPIKSFKLSDHRQSAFMKIHLLPHQLIDFGVFVEVTNCKQPATLMFCDPQASNDPIKKF